MTKKQTRHDVEIYTVFQININYAQIVLHLSNQREVSLSYAYDLHIIIFLYLICIFS